MDRANPLLRKPVPKETCPRLQLGSTPELGQRACGRTPAHVLATPRQSTLVITRTALRLPQNCRHQASTGIANGTGVGSEGLQAPNPHLK